VDSVRCPIAVEEAELLLGALMALGTEEGSYVELDPLPQAACGQLGDQLSGGAAIEEWRQANYGKWIPGSITTVRNGQNFPKAAVTAKFISCLRRCFKKSSRAGIVVPGSHPFNVPRIQPIRHADSARLFLYSFIHKKLSKMDDDTRWNHHLVASSKERQQTYPGFQGIIK
jgi:hypothetical protein